MPETDEIEELPIGDNLFLSSENGNGSPKLLARRCRTSGELYFPRDTIFTDSGDFEDVELGGTGRLIATTVIHRGLPGFPSPYSLAVVKLDDGLSLIAQLEDWEDKSLEPDTPVELVIGCIKVKKGGTKIVGPKFKVL